MLREAHHFNYEIQCWILRGRVLPCAHPTEMRVGRDCCRAFTYQGLTEHAAVQNLRTQRALKNIEYIGRGVAPHREDRS